MTPKSIEFHWKYGGFQNHELGIVKTHIVFITKVERGISVTPKSIENLWKYECF